MLRRVFEALWRFPSETVDALLFWMVESGAGAVALLLLLLALVLVWARLELIR